MITQIWLYSLASVLVVSLVSLAGIFTLGIKIERLRKILIYFISFSAGALFGDAFIHLLPEAIKENGFGIFISLSVICGIVIFFILEKFVHWQHCHMPITKTHIHNFAYMNLIGDSLHNFIDGLIIAASYIASIPLGLATTIAVIAHEIPQEIGDFGVLLHGGFTRGKALLMNFLTALLAVVGVIAGLILKDISGIQKFLIPFAVGGFIYVAGSDLIPELHKETNAGKSFVQIISFIIGVLVMLALLMIG
jgi:zinc and cadmium transporter